MMVRIIASFKKWVKALHKAILTGVQVPSVCVWVCVCVGGWVGGMGACVY